MYTSRVRTYKRFDVYAAYKTFFTQVGVNVRLWINDLVFHNSTFFAAPILFQKEVVAVKFVFREVEISVTRFGDLLDFGQFFKAFGNN